MYRFLLSMLLLLSATLAQAEVWTDTDWSGGNWATSDLLDPDISPGELVLLNDPLHFVPAMASTGYDGIFSLAAFQDRLYLAAGGNPPLITTIGDILVYDYETNTWALDYSVDEEGIVVLKVHDGILFSPGADALSTDYWGNLYYNAGDGWVKKETIPFARHVFDIFFLDGKIWVTTGQGIPNYRASLFSSADMGDTWVEEFSAYAHPPDTLWRRFYAATTFGGSIFIQSDFLEPEGHVIIEIQPGGNVVYHDITAYTECIAGFQEFKGKLWCHFRYALNAYDGTTWTNYANPVGSPNYPARAITVFKDRMYIGGLQNIVATDDGLVWDHAQIDQNTDRVFESLEQFHGRLYAGSNPYGELYVSAVPGGGSLDSQPHCFAEPLATGVVIWEALLQGPDTAVKFQIRSAGSENELPQALFLGPDGTETSWYETSGTPLAAAHSSDTCFQYRVRLESADPRFAPVLQSFQLEAGGLTAVPESGPARLALTAQPNPFNPRTSLHFLLEKPATVELVIFDVRGRRLATLQHGHLDGGDHAVAWNGCDDEGRGLPGGVYFARLVADKQVTTQRLVLIR